MAAIDRHCRHWGRHWGIGLWALGSGHANLFGFNIFNAMEKYFQGLFRLFYHQNHQYRVSVFLAVDMILLFHEACAQLQMPPSPSAHSQQKPCFPQPNSQSICHRGYWRRFLCYLRSILYKLLARFRSCRIPEALEAFYNLSEAFFFSASGFHRNRNKASPRDA